MTHPYKGNARKTVFDPTLGIQGAAKTVALHSATIMREMLGIVDHFHGMGITQEDAYRVVGRLFFMRKNAACQIAEMYRPYLRPTDPAHVNFSCDYISRIDPTVLDSFSYHLTRYYHCPTEGIGPRIWLTADSIEVRIPTLEGEEWWHDLIELNASQGDMIGKTIAGGIDPHSVEAHQVRLAQSADLNRLALARNAPNPSAYVKNLLRDEKLAKMTLGEVVAEFAKIMPSESGYMDAGTPPEFYR